MGFQALEDWWSFCSEASRSADHTAPGSPTPPGVHLPSVEVISAQAESLGEALPHNSRDSGTLHLEHLLQVCSVLFPPNTVPS